MGDCDESSYGREGVLEKRRAEEDYHNIISDMAPHEDPALRSEISRSWDLSNRSKPLYTAGSCGRFSIAVVVWMNVRSTAARVCRLLTLKRKDVMLAWSTMILQPRPRHRGTACV